MHTTMEIKKKKNVFRNLFILRQLLVKATIWYQEKPLEINRWIESLISVRGNAKIICLKKIKVFRKVLKNCDWDIVKIEANFDDLQ